ncbi:uncharacterized protein LOC118760850 [Octopus sinensis]|uniref:Uncharacterized protein LOC118760850 n=1 Tax=Octopus sinensis TaxID=2607531 RepID=A0A7E6EL87_9MOLL|nr:uncharacterized protein LOC118760850 [Octopus sinensis]
MKYALLLPSSLNQSQTKSFLGKTSGLERFLESAKDSKVSFYLDTYQSKDKARKHFDKLQRASIASLLEESLKEYFKCPYGGRKEARKVAVILLKGELRVRYGLEKNVKSLRKRGIEVFGIKMENRDSEMTLTRIFGKRNILDATKIKSMEEVRRELVNRICK